MITAATDSDPNFQCHGNSATLEGNVTDFLHSLEPSDEIELEKKIEEPDKINYIAC